MNTSSRLLSAALLLSSTSIVFAQPAGAPTDPAQPAEPAQPAQPAEGTQPTPPTPVVTTTTTTVAVVEPAPEEPKKKDEKPVVNATYDGGLKLTGADGSYEMKLSFRNQMRFEANRSLDEGNKGFTDRFYIARSRLQAEGHLFGKDNRYKLEFAFGDQGSFSFIKDMWMEKKVAEKVYLRFGQWKRPFNRQEMVSDYSSTFNERSIENEFAGGGRDLGVALHNDYEKSPEGVEWVVGVFNGFSGGADRPSISTTCTPTATMSITCTNSRASNFPTDFGPTLVARAGYNSPKMKGYSESDLEGGPLRYAVGVSYKLDLADFDTGKEDSWSSNISHGLEADALIKAMGFSVHAGVVMMKIKSGDPEYGVLVQPGLMLVEKKLELAGRFGLVTESAADRNQIEARIALNNFWHGHTWKIATDAGFLKFIGDGAMDDKADLQFRAMMQLQI